MIANPTADWQGFHREIAVVDLHVHPAMQRLFDRDLSLADGVRDGLPRLTALGAPSVRASFPRLRDGGYSVIYSAIHVPERGLLQDFPFLYLYRFLRPNLWRELVAVPPFTATLRLLDDMERAISRSDENAPTRLARSPRELDEILVLSPAERPIAVVHTIEGAHCLIGDDPSPDAVLANLQLLHQRGVASITLAHFYPNGLAFPTYPFPDNIARLSLRPRSQGPWQDLTLGLTELGERVVERMIELGIVVDISHCTPAARKRIYEIADASGKRVPLAATHIGAQEIKPDPANLSDWEIRRIARDGGVIGVIFMPSALVSRQSDRGLSTIVRTIEHIVEVGGEDVVGIGSDFDGFATPPADLDDASQMHRLTRHLLLRGHSEARVRKILGGNALRVLRDVWRP